MLERLNDKTFGRSSILIVEEFFAGTDGDF